MIQPGRKKAGSGCPHIVDPVRLILTLKDFYYDFTIPGARSRLAITLSIKP